MDFKYCYRKVFLFAFFLLYTTLLFAQNTVVSGTVTDAANKKPVPFVAVSFPGNTMGVNADDKGFFTISTDQSVTQLKVSFLGYKDAVLPVTPGKEQVLNVKLIPIAKQLNEVVVTSGKKPKYRNKDNPAVELIRKVIENREKNRPES